VTIPESARITKSRKFRFKPEIVKQLNELSPEPGTQGLYVASLISRAYAKSTRASKKAPTKP